MLKFNIIIGLCVALWSMSVYAVPRTYTAKPIYSDTSALKLNVMLTSQSTKGYCAVVSVHNVGGESHRNWQVEFDLGGNMLKHLSDAKYVLSGSHVTVTPHTDGASIESGHKSKFHFCTEGNSGPSAFQQTIKLTSRPFVASLVTSYTIYDNKKHDHDNIKVDYCVAVTIHNEGPDDVPNWRLFFDLGEDQLTSVDHGKPDKETHFITVTPRGHHSHIKRGYNRTIKYCAKKGGVSCPAPGEETILPTAMILSPQSGGILQTDRVLVSGIYSGPPHSGVTVNGIVALTDGYNFYANNVPLELGSYRLEAVVTSPLGRTAKHAVTVEAAGDANLLLDASPHTGSTVPFKAAFHFSFTGRAAIRSIAMDFNGDGVYDFTTADPRSPIEYTYSNPGIYHARMTLSDVQGGMFQSVYVIRVFDYLYLDTMFNRIFSDMNAALRCGYIDHALSYVSVHSRERYRPVFSKLKDLFPEIIDSYSLLQRSIISEGFAEYAVNRIINGVEHIFFVYFMQDDDGIWRIDSM